MTDEKHEFDPGVAEVMRTFGEIIKSEPRSTEFFADLAKQMWCTGFEIMGQLSQDPRILETLEYQVPQDIKQCVARGAAMAREAHNKKLN